MRLSIGERWELLQAMVRRMAVLPGQRTIVLISPGFMTPDLSTAVNGMVEEAARNGVVVNAVDARGFMLLRDTLRRAKGCPTRPCSRGSKDMRRRSKGCSPTSWLQLAHGTGGTLFENSNNLRGGIERAAVRPEVRYVLGFSPPQEKAYGAFTE